MIDPNILRILNGDGIASRSPDSADSKVANDDIVDVRDGQTDADELARVFDACHIRSA